MASRFAKAKVRGFQGTTSPIAGASAVAATAKHFCAYGAALAGREYASADVSERDVARNLSAAVRGGGGRGLRRDHAGFQRCRRHADDRPCCAAARLAARRHGFDGVIVSDYNAIAELLRHGVAGDLAEAAALALNAGVDIDMMSDAYSRGLPEALERGLVRSATIDAAVRRVLKLKERLGLFDDPYRRGSAGADAPTAAKAQAVSLRARLAGARSSSSPTTMCCRFRQPCGASPSSVRWPMPARRCLGRGRAPESAADPVTIREGLARRVAGGRDHHCAGASRSMATDMSGISAAREICQDADLVVLCLGEAAEMSGEAASRANPGLPGVQSALAEAMFDLGKPVVALLSSGRPLTIRWHRREGAKPSLRPGSLAWRPGMPSPTC